MIVSGTIDVSVRSITSPTTPVTVAAVAISVEVLAESTNLIVVFATFVAS